MTKKGKKIEIRDIRSGDFLWMKKKVLPHINKHAGPNGVTLYVWLCFYSNSKTQECFPSIETLANHMGKSRSTVLRTLKTLEQIKVIRVYRFEGLGNRYYLVDVEDIVMEKDIYGTSITHDTGVNHETGPVSPMTRVPVSPMTPKQDLIEQDLINNSSGQKQKPAALPYEPITEEQKQILQDLCQKVNKMPISQSNKFNVFMFMQTVANKCGYPPPPAVMIRACERFLADKSIKKPWGWFTTVVKAESGQFFAKLNVEEGERLKQEPVNSELIGSVLTQMQKAAAN